MDIEVFIREIERVIGERPFFTGVPDSQLMPLCNYLTDNYGTEKSHVIAANEGNAVAIAAGYHLATGKTAAVYLQNSGIGNIINPVASLLNGRVYGIPCMFVVGWRGEPGVHDEPQHVFQGEITRSMLELSGIKTFVLTAHTGAFELSAALQDFEKVLKGGGQAAVIVSKGALKYNNKTPYQNQYTMSREQIINRILDYAAKDIVISTTGKASRELYEARISRGQGHDKDFLTVGSMGHSSSIALGVALQEPDARVWCIDGDGAALMHMGAMAVIGAQSPANMVHIVINNRAHESVGGMPTAKGADYAAAAAAFGYKNVIAAQSPAELDAALDAACAADALCFIEARASIGARDNLGRPAEPPKQNKQSFMAYLKERR